MEMTLNISAKEGTGFCAYFASETPYAELPCMQGIPCSYFHGVYGGRGITCRGELDVKPEVGNGR